MTFDEVLDQVIDMLQRRGRVSYRALKRQFDLDDAYLADLKAEIIDVHQLAVDQDGTMLVMMAVLATGQELSRPLCLVLLADAAGQAGQVQEGLRLLAEALTAFEASGRGDMLAEAYRLQGELLLRQATPDASQAEACFKQALAIARRQQAKSWELRAAMSLSRLWQQQGKRTEAYNLLAPIYGWFTEGFDTADLQEARALLEALGR